MWEQSRCSSNKRLRGWPLCAALALMPVLAFGACVANLSDSQTATEAATGKVQGNGSTAAASEQASEKQQPERGLPKDAVPMEDQRGVGSIEALLAQLRRAGAPEAKAAKMLLGQGEEMSAQRRWGPAAKAFGESAMYKPSAAALVGLAHSTLMSETRRDNPRILEVKLRDFKAAVEEFRIALDFSERPDDPLPAGELAKVKERIACLETFIKNPDPATPGLCSPVREALKQNGIE